MNKAKPTLKDLPWDAPTIPWAEWKAKELNRLFESQGATKRKSNITPATVRDGESKCQTR